MTKVEQWDKIPENQISKLITIADTLINSREQLGNIAYWHSQGDIGLETVVRAGTSDQLFLLQSDSHFISGSVDEDGKRSRDYYKSINNNLYKLSFALDPNTVEGNPNSPLTPTLDIIHRTNSPEHIMVLNLASKFVVAGGTRQNPNCLFFVLNSENPYKNSIFVNLDRETQETGLYMIPREFSTITQYASENDAAMILSSSASKVFDLVRTNTITTLRDFMEAKRIENPQEVYNSLFVTIGSLLHDMLKSVEHI